MNFQITKRELSAALAHTAHGVAGRIYVRGVRFDTLQICQNHTIGATFTAWGGEVVATARVYGLRCAPVDKVDSVRVSHRTFKAAISKAKVKPLDVLTVTADADFVKIATDAGEVVAVVPTLSEPYAEFPALRLAPITGYTVRAGNKFANVLEAAYTHTAKEDNRPILQGAALRCGSDGDVTELIDIMAGDGYRAAFYRVGSNTLHTALPVETTTHVVHRDVLRGIAAMARYKDARVLNFEYGNRAGIPSDMPDVPAVTVTTGESNIEYILFTNLIDGKYPDTYALVYGGVYTERGALATPVQIRTQVSTLTAITAMAQSLAQRGDKEFFVTFIGAPDGTVSVTFKSYDIDKPTPALPVTATACSEFRASINATYLRDAAAALESNGAWDVIVQFETKVGAAGTMNPDPTPRIVGPACFRAEHDGVPGADGLALIMPMSGR